MIEWSLKNFFFYLARDEIRNSGSLCKWKFSSFKKKRKKKLKEEKFNEILKLSNELKKEKNLKVSNEKLDILMKRETFYVQHTIRIRIFMLCNEKETRRKSFLLFITPHFCLDWIKSKNEEKGLSSGVVKILRMLNRLFMYKFFKCLSKLKEIFVTRKLL